jgi:hypothetical protein
MLYDNPAAALQNILQRGLEEKQAQPCHEVWSRILEIRSDDPGELIARLGEVMDLPRRTLVFVQASFPNQLKATTTWKAEIENAFMQQHLNGLWVTFISHVSPYCIGHLSLTSELIQTRLKSSIIASEDLTNVLQSLSSLVAEIDDSDLQVQLKAYLTREINDLQHSIRTYKISGAVPILRHTEAMLGHSLVDPEYSSFLSSHPLGARLLENLSAMANLLTVAVSLPQLSQGLTGLLLK